MTTISSYDMQQLIAKRFTPSMESEQEIEIETEQVIINQTLEIGDMAEDVSADVAETNDALDKSESVEQVTESLESLIVTMESSLLAGGFDVTNATLANIALESITRRFDLPVDELSFGLEEVATDGEAETKSVIGKAKGMLGALKDNTAALISKMYLHATAALGSTSALSDRILASTSKIRAAIDMENPGTTILPLNQKAGAKISTRYVPLKPEEYLKELKRSLDKYNEVVKIYSDNRLLESFVQDIITSLGKSDAQPKSRRAILSAVKNMNQGMSKPVSIAPGVVAYASEPYLGNVCIVSKKPDPKHMVEMFNESLTTKKVSQEGVGRYVGSAILQGAGAMLFYTGQLGMFLGTAGAIVATGVPLTMLAFSMAVIGYYGTRKGVDVMKKGFDTHDEEIQKAVSAFKNTISKNAQEVSDMCTEFTLSKQNDISMESEKTFDVQALNPKQILQALALIDNTAATSRNMKQSLAGRKALIKQIDGLTKEIAKAEGNNSAMTKAASTFVKKYLKQTIKFEMDMTKYGLDTMRGALNYISLCNSKMVRDVIAEMNLEAQNKAS